jgi:hypothetical protein
MQPVRQRDDARYDRDVVRIVSHCGNEGAIDLQRIDRQSCKVSQRGIAGAEIIDRHLRPSSRYAIQPVDDILCFFQEHAFGNLEIQRGSDYRDWLASDINVPPIAVNVSPHQ